MHYVNIHDLTFDYVANWTNTTILDMQTFALVCDPASLEMHTIFQSWDKHVSDLNHLQQRASSNFGAQRI